MELALGPAELTLKLKRPADKIHLILRPGELCLSRTRSVTLLRAALQRWGGKVIFQHPYRGGQQTERRAARESVDGRGLEDLGALDEVRRNPVGLDELRPITSGGAVSHELHEGLLGTERLDPSGLASGEHVDATKRKRAG